MSWWISVIDKDEKTISTDHNRCEGGTVQVGGTTEATLNVTYNYGKHFSFKELHGLPVGDAHTMICAAIEKLRGQLPPP